MNQDTLIQFIKAEVARHDDEIGRNAQARFLAQHARLIAEAGSPWLSDMAPDYNRSEQRLIEQCWKSHQEEGGIPDLLPVDEELDTRMKMVSDVLTRLGEAAALDYDYVENLLEPLTGQSEYRYWLNRTVVRQVVLLDE